MEHRHTNTSALDFNKMRIGILTLPYIPITEEYFRHAL